MKEFADTIGPIFIITLCILAAVGVYRLVLHIVAKTLEVRLDYERRRIDNQTARDNGKLVTQNQQAMVMSRKHVEAGTLYNQQFQVLLADIDSRRLPQPVPNSLHWAPHIIDKRPAAEAAPSLTALPAPAAIVPSFRELFRNNTIGSGRFLLGFRRDDGTPYYGTLEDVYSSLIIAKSGAGKTTLQRFLLAQAVLQGAKIAVVDPHGMAEQGLVKALSPLKDYFLFPPAVEDEQIDQTLRYFWDLTEARKLQKDRSTDIRILACDEMNALIQESENEKFVVDSLKMVAKQGRKFFLYAFASGQSAEASETGGDASLRKAFVGRFVLRSDRDAVQRLIPNKDLLDTVPGLRPGQAIFVPTGGDPVSLIIPNTTIDDLEACFGGQKALPGRAQVVDTVPLTVPPTVPLTVPDDDEMVISGTVDDNDMELLNTQKAQRAIALLTQGEKHKTIIETVWKVQQENTRAFVKASNEWHSILVAYMRKGVTNG